jgi:hypothetical protein
VIGDVSTALSPVAKVGVVGFPSTQTVPLTAPASFTNDLAGFTPDGGTQFDLGITRARDMLQAPSSASQDLVVLLTDGDGSYAPVTGVDGIVIKAFTIAGVGCSSGIAAAVASGAPGSECIQVTDLDALPAVISDTIGSSLDSIDITVNGSVVQTIAVAAPGPSSTNFSPTLTGLAAGNDVEVCAVAHATDSGGSGTVSDCSTIDILPAGTVVVDCSGSGTCTGTATDTGRSTLTFQAPAEFDETVTIAADRGGATSCGGSACTTGYNVGFPTNDPNGPIATITVVTAKKVSLKDRLKAAVYLEGARVTKQCNNRFLARWRDRWGIPEPIPCITITYRRDGRLEYFVKFNADPVIRFR